MGGRERPGRSRLVYSKHNTERKFPYRKHLYTELYKYRKLFVYTEDEHLLFNYLLVHVVCRIS